MVPERFRMAPDGPGRSRNGPGRFRKVPEGSGRFQNIPEVFLGCPHGWATWEETHMGLGGGHTTLLGCHKGQPMGGRGP